jgi:hypothetical protein
MGSADASERELHQGLIKLAAAHVHAIRGNRLGVRKNLVGARSRLAAVTTPPEVGDELDVPALLGEVDHRLARLDDPATTLESLLTDPPTVRRRHP